MGRVRVVAFIRFVVRAEPVVVVLERAVAEVAAVLPHDRLVPVHDAAVEDADGDAASGGALRPGVVGADLRDVRRDPVAPRSRRGDGQPGLEAIHARQAADAQHGIGSGDRGQRREVAVAHEQHVLDPERFARDAAARELGAHAGLAAFRGAAQALVHLAPARAPVQSPRSGKVRALAELDHEVA